MVRIAHISCYPSLLRKVHLPLTCSVSNKLLSTMKTKRFQIEVNTLGSLSFNLRMYSFFVLPVIFQGVMGNLAFKNTFLVLHLQIRSSCEETFDRCLWNGEEFDCCSHFLQLETELGICYSINNVQTVWVIGFPIHSHIRTVSPNFEAYDYGDHECTCLMNCDTPSQCSRNSSQPRKTMNLKSDRSTGPGSLRLDFKTPTNVSSGIHCFHIIKPLTHKMVAIQNVSFQAGYMTNLYRTNYECQIT